MNPLCLETKEGTVRTTLKRRIVLKKVELSCKQAVSEAIRFRKNQLKRAKDHRKDTIQNELKYLEYHKDNLKA